MRANLEFVGAEAVDLPIAEGRQPSVVHPFKGNMDVAALAQLIARVGRERVPLVMLTVPQPRQGRKMVAQGASPGIGGPHPACRTPLPPERERGRG